MEKEAVMSPSKAVMSPSEAMMAPSEAMMAPKLNGRLINNAIRRLGGSSGSTTVEIKNYLLNEKKLECDAPSIKLYLKNAVDAGKLSLLNGKYKVNETARRRRKSSGGSPKRRRRRRSGSRRKSSKGSRKRSRRRSGSRRRRRSRKVAAEGAE